MYLDSGKRNILSDFTGAKNMYTHKYKVIYDVLCCVGLYLIITLNQFLQCGVLPTGSLYVGLDSGFLYLLFLCECG
ncbi:hypothetical protein J3Q64DRAFT_1716846 [Phycomyces blakesleeanus]|uniref:Uncharacterized protein n=1 Tax=Phycomyces blakesleeanus TaxID=4837 RepID=A0ABR3BHE6_PHYBL